MSETIGQQLAAARESLELTIEDVAHKTRIHRDVLIQLEADDYDKLPNLMFAKSFIKLYSDHVGVDSSLAVAQLTAANDDHGRQYLLGGISPRIRDNFGRLTSRIPVRPILATAAALAFLTIGGSYLVTHLYGGEGQTAQPAEQADENPGATPSAETQPEPTDKVVDADPDDKTTPVSNTETKLVPNTVKQAPSEPTITKRAPIDPASIPKAIPISEEDAEADNGEEEESETAVSEETFEPFVVTPGVVVTEE